MTRFGEPLRPSPSSATAEIFDHGPHSRTWTAQGANRVISQIPPDPLGVNDALGSDLVFRCAEAVCVETPAYPSATRLFRIVINDLRQ